MSAATVLVRDDAPTADATAEPVAIALESDGTLLLTKLAERFAGATGLRFHPEDAPDTFKTVRLENGALHAPEGAAWKPVFFVVRAESTPAVAAAAAAAAAAATTTTAAAAAPATATTTTADASSNGAASDGSAGGVKRKAEDEADDGPRKKENCYKCGGFGHIQDFCPSPSGSIDMEGAVECHLCKGKGHVKMRCPNSVPSNVCYLCQMPGHFARECPRGRGM